MTPEETIRALMADAAEAADEQQRSEARTAARVAWAREIIAAMMAAHKKVEDAWNRILDDLPEDVDDEDLEDIPDPPEQAELDAILEQIDDVRERDLWPRHLYWSL